MVLKALGTVSQALELVKLSLGPKLTHLTMLKPLQLRHMQAYLQFQSGHATTQQHPYTKHGFKYTQQDQHLLLMLGKY